MADAQVLYDEDVAATVADVAAWVTTAIIPAASFTANKRYLIIANAAVEIASATAEAKVRLAHGTTPTVFTDGTLLWESVAALSTSVHEESWLFDFTQPGTTEDVLIQITSGTTADVTNRLSQILVIKLDDDFTSGTDYVWAEDLTDYTMTATPTAKATTASFTPNGTDRWLFIGHMIHDVVTVVDEIGFELFDSVASVLSMTQLEGEDAANEIHGHNLYWAGIPSNAARTLAVRPFNEAGSNVMLASRVFAINLAKFAQSAHVFTAAEVDPATAPTYTNLATIAPNPTNTGDWVYIAFATHDVGELTSDMEVRVQVNPSGGGLVDDPAFPNSNVPGIDAVDPLDESVFSVFKLRSLTSGAARDINFDARQVAGTLGRWEDRGLVAFSVELAAAGNQTVTPTTAALVLATFAPTIKHEIIVPVAGLVLTTFAPVVKLTVTPTTASLATSAFAPTVTTPQTITPDIASLALTPFAPTVTGGAGTTVTPDTASLSLAAFAPTIAVSDHQVVTPGVTAVALTTFAPVVSATAHQTVVPDVAALSMTAFAPNAVLTDHQLVTPPVAALALTPFAPNVTGGAGLTVVPSTASLSMTAFAPTVVLTDHKLVVPDAATLATALFAPTVTLGGNQLATPSTAALILAAFAPSVTAGGAPLPDDLVALVMTAGRHTATVTDGQSSAIVVVVS